MTCFPTRQLKFDLGAPSSKKKKKVCVVPGDC